MPTDLFKSFLKFVGRETEPYSEPVRIAEDIAGCEDDALGLEQRPTELLSVLKPVGNRREAVDACGLEPVEIVAFDELSDAFSVRFRVGTVRLKNIGLLLTERLSSDVLTENRRRNSRVVFPFPYSVREFPVCDNPAETRTGEAV